MKRVLYRVSQRPIVMALAVLLLTIGISSPAFPLGSGGDRHHMLPPQGAGSRGPVPEIGAGTIGGGVALLVGGLALLRQRKRR